jgi:DNA-binding transcriptional LysR family regulator
LFNKFLSMSENIKYRQLKAFGFAMETGSFKDGSDRLSITQPSFSSLIKELESDVGTVLFLRTPRGCTPTEWACAFYSQIKGPLEHLEEAYRLLKEVSGGQRGFLRLAAPPSLAAGVITRSLSDFKKRYPNVKISLHERKHHQIVEAVRNGEVEFGIGAMLRPDPEVSFDPLFTDVLMVVAPHGHPITCGRRSWKMLEGFDLILQSGGPAEHALRACDVQPMSILEVEQAETAISMVHHGLGITILPSSVMGGQRRGQRIDDLALIPLPGKRAVRHLGSIRRKNRVASAAARNFITMLQAEWRNKQT